MVRFSCFHPHIHNHKPKKTGQPPAESMHKALQDRSRSEVSKDSPRSIALNQSLVKTASDNQISNSANHMALIIENGRSANQTCGFKKSQSLGSMPYGEGSSTADNDTEYGIDNQGFSCENSQYRLEISDYGKDQEISSPDRFKENTGLKSFHLKSDPVIREVIFSIDDSPHREKEDGENSDSSLFRESVGDFGKDTPHATHMIVKSCSMPNIDTSSPVSSGGSPYKSLLPHSRSSGELHLLDPGVKEMSLHEIEVQVNGCHSIADDMPKTEKINFEISKHDNDKVIIPMENLRGEPMVQYNDEFPGNDFKIKRIEEWVSDLQLCSPPDEATEVYQSSDEVKKDLNIIVGSSTARIDTKVTAGMEAAKRYISSMNAASTTAQLTNYGLVVIPFLSAFVGLKVLNLSSNSIVKITAGVLPRGLHMLNLSKNSIATIEGLRELTRLRLLDLSYNRIFRIGHGLASCSSLKELYLAGNKISEVEGLHRLLKLSILDLRCNKISTIKSLGQLAANYNSLQAISLEGNPAQKNVGDDQLKKQLQGLLPHLVYYNRQPTKGSILKDGADRSVRLGVSGHQFDHGIRSDHKSSRKLAHGSPARPSSSSTHGHRSHGFVSPRGSRLRHGHISALPPTGNKVISRHHHFDISSRPLEFTADSFIRRSRSEGTLADL